MGFLVIRLCYSLKEFEIRVFRVATGKIAGQKSIHRRRIQMQRFSRMVHQIGNNTFFQWRADMVKQFVMKSPPQTDAPVLFNVFQKQKMS